jgi:hypothetical protein
VCEPTRFSLLDGISVKTGHHALQDSDGQFGDR